MLANCHMGHSRPLAALKPSFTEPGTSSEEVLSQRETKAGNPPAISCLGLWARRTAAAFLRGGSPPWGDVLGAILTWLKSPLPWAVLFASQKHLVNEISEFVIKTGTPRLRCGGTEWHDSFPDTQPSLFHAPDQSMPQGHS